MGLKTKKNGTRRWENSEDLLHRTDGPACEYSNGSKFWHKNSKLHREDGPALENMNGSKQWLTNGKWHRTDGPAIERSDGYKQWWIKGKRYIKEEEYKKEIIEKWV